MLVLCLHRNISNLKATCNQHLYEEEYEGMCRDAGVSARYSGRDKAAAVVMALCFSQCH